MSNYKSISKKEKYILDNLITLSSKLNRIYMKKYINLQTNQFTPNMNNLQTNLETIYWLLDEQMTLLNEITSYLKKQTSLIGVKDLETEDIFCKTNRIIRLKACLKIFQLQKKKLDKELKAIQKSNARLSAFEIKFITDMKKYLQS